jgi:hypothetical protein
MKIQRSWLVIGFLASAFAAGAQETIPSGTIIPVMLNGSLSSKKTKPGAMISARVMQDVPLPNGIKIREGSKVKGRVIQVQPAAQGKSASISLTFDHVLAGKQDFAVATDLRAIASMSAVDGAKIPAFGMGEGESWNNRVTTQIGGDTVYWGGGPVVSSFGPVGKPLGGAANSGVLVKVTAAPGSPCRGQFDDNQGVQALWVFSSDACGVYGLGNIAIAHAGRTPPLGVIELNAQDEDVRVSSGSGMLLRVIPASKQ